MNTQALGYPQFDEELQHILELHRTNTLFYPSSESWDHFKLNIKKLAIKRANRMKKQKQQKLKN